VSAREKILVALSGGVDSSVAALLLKRQGCDVVGAYMKNWINEDEVIGHCPWEQDIADARAVAEQIGIEFHVVNLMRDYRARVVDYLLDGYARGLTPNPDVMCNREIKFGVFRAWARDHGFAAVATGHYAQRLPLAGAARAPTETGDFALFVGVDPDKDQSYFLALLSQEQLRDARFPIGHLTKPALRQIACDAGLVTAAKKDSQGICFIGQVKMQDFLRSYVPDQPGPIVRATDGRELGRHRGLHYYTLGQRKGIGVTKPQPLYVLRLDPAERRVVVGSKQELGARDLQATGVNWIAGVPPAGPTRVTARIRHRHADAPATVVSDGDGLASLVFDEPQLAIAPGQAVVFYDGDDVLGGGWIANRAR